MTVRELIEHLQTLDPDKDIWVCYDGGCGWFEPTADGQVDREYKKGLVKKGDYFISAG